ncbi:MAG TPA: SRPBCC family protein [Burkholderiales bacterium]|nr:SRPBCC family protein [Burkholderiales bacterium]
MASIRKEFALATPAEAVWAALRDVGAVHTRLAPGFVTDCRMDGRERIVTFANGAVARELIVDVDDNARRLAYSARTPSIEHHHASVQVFDDGPGRCRLVWIADVLPSATAKVISAMMDEGVAAMRKTLESHSQPA